MSPQDTDDPQAELRRAAELARLELSDDELGELAPGFGRVLAAFEALREWPVEARLDAASKPRRREDQPIPSLERASLLERAPDPQDGFFGVPKTLGGEG